MLVYSERDLKIAAEAYVEAMFFFDGAEEEDQFYGCDDDYDHIKEFTNTVVLERVREFVGDNKNRLEYFLNEGRDYTHIGHDLYLTEKGHGAGFWDRGMGAIGDLLTESCENNNLVNRLYVDDDNKIAVE